MLRSNQQGLDGASTRDSTAKQSRRKDARVVDDEHITRSQESREVPDAEMADLLTAVERQMHQSSVITLGRRLLSNEVWGKVELELADVHPR